ncbi:hypothetical protein D0863_11431 [Hortaea werneckii]|uniref:Uncharacterized protein n=1 Tax=Hortaea werneckii TaxID=91943 RepID=A0A3M7DA97_HORWE|nr:hypothetical protein D0863_11431 [Hortaea werneckii]
MPPANTPETSSQSRPPSPPPPSLPSLHQARPLTPLSYLSSPVPDLASTLHPAASTQPMSAADDADEANSAFLRDALEVLERDPQQAIDGGNGTRSTTHVDPLRDPRRRPPAERAGGDEATAVGMSHRQAGGETSEDLSRRERLQRVLARLNRLHEPASTATSAAAVPARGEREAYSNRTPEPHMQSLYDWAPAGQDRDSEMAGAEGDGQGSGASSQQQQQHGGDGRELDAILRELRRQQQAPLAETGGSAEILRMLSQSQGAHRRRSHARGNGSVEQSHGHENTLAPLRSNTLDIAERRERLRERERRRRENEWVSLRARAALQRSREASADGSGASPSATDRMLRYVLERERRGVSEEEDRARGTGWLRPSPPTPVPGHDGLAQYQQRIPNAMRQSHDASWMLPPPSTGPDGFTGDRDRAERVEAFRRGYLADNVPGGGAGPPRLPRILTPPIAPSMSTNAAWASGSTSSGSTAFLENAMKYLSDLRSCHSYEDALSAAIDHGLATKEFFADKHDDFIMDLHGNEEDSEEHSFPWSSWLQPGTVFDGHQYAMNGTSSSSIAHNVEQINPHYHPSSSRSAFDHPPGSTRVAIPPAPFDATRPWLSHIPPSHPSHFDGRSTTSTSDDQWPVRVVINSVNPEKMTLQGTMEAYDVPQHPQPHHILTGGPNNTNSSTSTQPTSNSEPTTPPPRRPRAGKKHAPITTFLEGQILSLNPHSFLTPAPPPPSSHSSSSSTYPHPPPTSSSSSLSSSSPLNPNKPPGSGGPTTGPHPTLPRNETPYTTLPTEPVFPPTTPRIDARNWARLPPFRDLGRRGSAGRGRVGDVGENEGEDVWTGGGGREEAGKDDLFPEREGEGEGEAGAEEAGRVGRGLGRGIGHEEKIEMEMARLLLSKSRWKREVMDRFVCMRWKEKCFVENFPSSSSSLSSRKQGKTGSEGVDGVGASRRDGQQRSVHPPERPGSADVRPDHEEQVGVDSAQDDDDHQHQQGHGLTISGFYYIVLDRQTGGVEGLYYDPASTPFQRLKLRGCSSGQNRRPSSVSSGGGVGDEKKKMESLHF